MIDCGNLWAAWAALIVSFTALAKCADLFVESSVALAERFRMPRLLVGILLVSLATTAPELAVSLTSALRGEPQMALGNAIGSVICDDGLALGLCGILSAVPIAVMPRILRTSGLFLLLVQALAFLFVVGDYTLNRIEGVVLVTLFACYMCFLCSGRRKGQEAAKCALPERDHPATAKPVLKIALFFAVSIAGIVVSSQFIIVSAGTIAVSFGIPKAIVAAVLVAFGTSIPEIATCVTAAVKKEGELAVGNIIGADIMNICWVAGASAIANDLEILPEELWFMFPWMFVIVGMMLFLLWRGYSLTRKKGLVLLCLYLVYLVSFFTLFQRS